MPDNPSSHRPANLHRPVWISLSCGLYWFAFSLTRPMISLYAASLGLGGIAIGCVLAVYAFLPMLAAIPGGLIADRWGKTAVLRAGSLLMLLSGMLYWASFEAWTLALAQLLAGLGQMSVWLAVQALITEGPQKGSESRFATFSLYMAIGQMIAPIISGYLSDRFGYKAVFAGYILSSLLLIWSAWQCREEAEARSRQQAAGPAQDSPNSNFGQRRFSQLRFGQRRSALRHRRLWRLRLPASANMAPAGKINAVLRQCLRLIGDRKFAVILLTTFISLFIVDVRTAYLPMHLESLNMSNTKVGILISIGAVSALFVRPIYPLLMTKLKFSWLLISTYAVSLLLLFVAPLLTGYALLAGLIFITGLALGINQPMTLSMIAGSTAAEERGLGVGLRLMSNRAAQLADPLLFGFFTSFTGLQASFLYVGCFLLLCCAFTVGLHLLSEKNTPKPKRSIPLLTDEGL